MNQESVDRIIEDTRAIYRPDRSIDDISDDISWELGRRLYEVGYKIGAIILRRDSNLKSSELLVENLVAKSDLRGRPFTITGPLYGRQNEGSVDETEYLNQNAIAFWRIYKQSPNGPNLK
jgi:hypothetical protein